MLSEHITDEMLNDAVSFEEAKELLALHVLGYNTSYELLQTTRNVKMKFSQRHRKALMDDGDCLVSLKFGLFKAVTANAKSAAHRRNIGVRNGLAESDFDLLDERTYPKLHKHIKALGKKYSALSYSSFQRYAERARKESVSNLRGFFMKKLTFLQNYGITREDIAGEVYAGTYRALLITYPRFETYAHFLNAYRRYSRQTGLRLIEDYTRKGNNVFDENGNLLKFSLDFETGDDSGDYLSDYCGSNFTIDTASQHLHVKEVLENLNTNQLRLFELLLGVKSDSFDAYLQKNDREVAKLYRQGDRSRDVVMAVLDYLSLPFADYLKIIYLCRGTKVPQLKVNRI